MPYSFDLAETAGNTAAAEFDTVFGGNDPADWAPAMRRTLGRLWVALWTDMMEDGFPASEEDSAREGFRTGLGRWAEYFG